MFEGSREIRGRDVSCEISSGMLAVNVYGVTVLERELSYQVVAASSNWTVSDSSLIVHLEKKITGFWGNLSPGDPEIDIRTLGPAVGMVGKRIDPNEPVKVEDPELIKQIALEHPELQLNNSAAEIGVEKQSSASFRGKSSFTW